MIVNKFDQHVFNENDIFDIVMQDRALKDLSGLLVDQSVDVDHLMQCLPDAEWLQHWHTVTDSDLSVEQFDQLQQANWHMPQAYKDLDIAEHVLGLCTSQQELQRCGQELLLYHEHNLFDLLRYLKYLVDTMKANNIVWGVGRGSSVASFVLYKLQVHKIDSLYYELDCTEFLR